MGEGGRRTYVFGELDVVDLAGRVTWAEEIADEEDDQHQLDGGSDGVVLVAGPDIADEDCAAGDLLEGGRRVVEKEVEAGLEVLEVHVCCSSSCLCLLFQDRSGM